MENKAKGTFMSFILGLIVGAWPFRWAMLGSTFLLGFFVGNAFHLMTTVLRWMASQQ